MLKKAKKIITKAKPISFCLGLALIVLDIVLFRGVNNFSLIAISLYWLTIACVYKFSEKTFFLLAIFLLFFVPIPLFFDEDGLATFTHEGLSERFAVWEYMFICFALFLWLKQETSDFLKEIKKKRKNQKRK